MQDDMGIQGLNVQRNQKNWENLMMFKKNNEFD